MCSPVINNVGKYKQIQEMEAETSAEENNSLCK